MIIGYVSDERFVALEGVVVEITAELTETGGSTPMCVVARSTPSGSIHADVGPGRYAVILAKDGFGTKRATVTVGGPEVHQFRLLADGLLGYMWPKSVRSGERSEFRVHSTEPYKLELWRYGATRELVRHIGWYDEHGPRATMQITPDGDYSRTGVHWNAVGYSAPHFLQFIEAPERSGLYYLHATTESGKFFGWPWIVAPAEPNHDVAVLASNINWNAYNNFGGRSNYANMAALPEFPIVNSRQDLSRYVNPNHVFYTEESYAPLAFERPEPLNSIPLGDTLTSPIEGRSASHLAAAEWHLLGWMEQQGIGFDLYAETQLDAEELDLDRYQILVLNTHPEYWTAKMYHKVALWVRTRGGRLMYLGGNGLNCEVTLTDDGAMIARNGSYGNAGKMTELGLDSRFHIYNESEASLLGVAYSESGGMTGAPYRTVAADHWIFAGTGLQAGDLFGTESLHMRCPGGASGHETDKITPQSPEGLVVLAKGTNPDGGGGEIVTYTTASGGAVFSVGSITWTSAITIDDIVARITANVFERFLTA